jgi:hypothetical protein
MDGLAVRVALVTDGTDSLDGGGFHGQVIRMVDRSVEPDQGLPERFFGEARRLLLRESEKLEFDPDDILKIAQDAALRAEFKDLFVTAVNDPQLGNLIIDYLEDVATDLEDKSKISDIRIELLDRAGVGVAASVTAAGIAAIIVSAGTLGAFALLCGGIIGLGATGTGRTIMRLNSQRSVSAAQKIRRLATGLRS